MSQSHHQQMEANNKNTKEIIEKMRAWIDTLGEEGYDFISNTFYELLFKDYIKQSAHCVKNLKKIIKDGLETPNKRNQLNVNQSTQDAFQNINDKNKSEAKKSITTFFHLSMKAMESMEEGKSKCEVHNDDTEGACVEFEIDNDQNQRYIQEKYQSDYVLMSLYYKVQFNEEFELGVYQPKVEEPTEYEIFKRLIKRQMIKEKMVYQNQIIEQVALLANKTLVLNKIKKRRLRRKKTWWWKEFCDDQKSGKKKNFMGEDYNICENCEELYCISKSQDDLQLEDGIGFCSPECYEEQKGETVEEAEKRCLEMFGTLPTFESETLEGDWEKEYCEQVVVRDESESDGCAWCVPCEKIEPFDVRCNKCEDLQDMKEYLVHLTPNDDADDEEDVDISCIEGELDNALFQQNMKWSYDKPKSGNFQQVYISNRKEGRCHTDYMSCPKRITKKEDIIEWLQENQICSIDDIENIPISLPKQKENCKDCIVLCRKDEPSIRVIDRCDYCFELWLKHKEEKLLS